MWTTIHSVGGGRGHMSATGWGLTGIFSTKQYRKKVDFTKVVEYKLFRDGD